jgi:hypothetical protein
VGLCRDGTVARRAGRVLAMATAWIRATVARQIDQLALLVDMAVGGARRDGGVRPAKVPGEAAGRSVLPKGGGIHLRPGVADARRRYRTWDRIGATCPVRSWWSASGRQLASDPAVKLAKSPWSVGRGPKRVAHFTWENRPPRATPILNRSPPAENGQVNHCTQNLDPNGVGGYM